MLAADERSVEDGLMNPEEFAERFRKRRLHLGLTLEQVAQRLDLAWQSVSAWEKGGMPRPHRYEAIARALETTVEELFYGIEPRPERVSERHTTQTYSSPVPQSVPIIPVQGRVPVIDWSWAGNWKAAASTFHPGDAKKWLYVTGGVGVRSFAVEMLGDSMEPKVPAGAFVVVDPDRPATHGSIVLARMPDGSAKLKKLALDDDQPTLVPINQRYPVIPMPRGTEIVGTAVQVVLEL